MPDVLNVEVRETRGTRNAQKLRQAGKVPAVLYGHGQGTVSLSIPGEEVATVVRQGTRFVDLQGALDENALISDVQWDPFGNDVLHLDLTRVVAGEKVELGVSLVIKGVAPGTRAGGVLVHALHEVQMECPVNSIPDHIEVNVNKLELLETITIADLTFPEGSTVLTTPETVVAQCIEQVQLEDEELSATDLAAEPEVIGRAKEDEEAEG